jgi:3-hydroxybutyryl-CoA dehydrogenase
MIRSRESSRSSNSVRQSNKPRTPSLKGTEVGVVGMGMMGSSIAACLLAAGHTVGAVEADAARVKKASRRVFALLKGLREERVLKADPDKLLRKLSISTNYNHLHESQIVIESVVENLDVKRRVIRQIEEVVPADTLLGSNTSAIPPTVLQQEALHPERILGIHWGEPAHITRFMEIICGENTLPIYAERALVWARQLGKEPSLLRKEVRGFITNRVMYAMLREAFHLVESGVASIADVDRSLRNDLGYWITFAGPFRFMDLTGIPAYCAVMRDLLPDLDCGKQVPLLMTKLVETGAQGVANASGFYDYTPAEAKRWERRFLQFSYDVRALAQKYSEKDGGGSLRDGAHERDTPDKQPEVRKHVRLRRRG